jgi:hypothetical protein
MPVIKTEAHPEIDLSSSIVDKGKEKILLQAYFQILLSYLLKALNTDIRAF